MPTLEQPQSPTETSTGRSRIFLVDDHPIVRRGLADLIEDEPDMEVCGEASDAAEALEKIPIARPDLVLIDISLNGPSGIELIAQIRASGQCVKMLVASMHDESMYASRALRAGALGYVKKEEATARVVEAIRSALAGNLYLSPSTSQRVLREMLGSPNDTSVTPLERLSNRELAVFELLGRGMKTREIAARLHCSPKTIETHRENIKYKLHLQNGTELIAYAARWGKQES